MTGTVYVSLQPKACWRGKGRGEGLLAEENRDGGECKGERRGRREMDEDIGVLWWSLSRKGWCPREGNFMRGHPKTPPKTERAN